MIKYNDNLTLITMRHYNQASLDELRAGKNILLEQLSRNTVRIGGKGKVRSKEIKKQESRKTGRIRGP